jgi:hypothetical protein
MSIRYAAEPRDVAMALSRLRSDERPKPDPYVTCALESRCWSGSISVRHRDRELARWYGFPREVS